MSNLILHIIIYAESSLRPHEAHVALTVDTQSGVFYVYHAIEDTNTEEEMKFEKQGRERDPLGSTTIHQEIVLPQISASAFKQLDGVLQNTPVPRPKPNGWNCQTWLRQALIRMESAGLIPKGTASAYYAQMMSKVNANTTK